MYMIPPARVHAQFAPPFGARSLPVFSCGPPRMSHMLVVSMRVHMNYGVYVHIYAHVHACNDLSSVRACTCVCASEARVGSPRNDWRARSPSAAAVARRPSASVTTHGDQSRDLTSYALSCFSCVSIFLISLISLISLMLLCLLSLDASVNMLPCPCLSAQSCLWVGVASRNVYAMVHACCAMRGGRER
jgi:hypothetical protein